MVTRTYLRIAARRRARRPWPRDRLGVAVQPKQKREAECACVSRRGQSTPLFFLLLAVRRSNQSRCDDDDDATDGGHDASVTARGPRAGWPKLPSRNSSANPLTRMGLVSLAAAPELKGSEDYSTVSRLAC